MFSNFNHINVMHSEYREMSGQLNLNSRQPKQFKKSKIIHDVKQSMVVSFTTFLKYIVSIQKITYNSKKIEI